MGNENGGVTRATTTRRLPKNSRGIRSFTMRELEAKDEMLAAIQVDQRLPAALKNNPSAVNEQGLRERIRLSLVDVNGEKVGGKFPYADLDSWPLKIYNAAKLAFIELNLMTDEETESFRQGAEEEASLNSAVPELTTATS